eukprot:1624978-Pyramimonas_sp.AAC.1
MVRSLLLRLRRWRSSASSLHHHHHHLLIPPSRLGSCLIALEKNFASLRSGRDCKGDADTA